MRLSPLWVSVCLLSLLACAAPKSAEQPLMAQPQSATLDQGLEAYKPPTAPLAGTIALVGSDSMDPLVKLWADDFRSLHAGVSFSIVSKGSGTAPKALLAGQASIGHMSREMSAQELEAYRAKLGRDPLRIVVAADALAIYVNANNPIKSLQMEQVDAIFSSTRKAGHDEVNTWGDLGLRKEWYGRSIQPYGRDENSGTRVFFKEHALKKGDYKAGVKPLPDQFAVVEAPAMDAAGISYGPIQHSVRMVRAVPLVDFGGREPMLPTVENILQGRYPLTRFLYLYVDKAPGKGVDPLLHAFLEFVLSRQGQTAVSTFGAVPLPADMAKQNLRKLN